MKVGLLHYGSGNLFSVTRALEECGAEVVPVETAEQVAASERLVIPGVGAFGDCMAKMADRGLAGPVCAYAASGRPMLGICVGMQVLFEWGEEFGLHQGLGLLGGRVVAIRGIIPDSGIKVPNIGWHPLLPAADWRGSILEGVPMGASCYFVHSFTAIPADRGHVLAEIACGSGRLTAVVRKGNITGCQFHPEKSGHAGLGILADFIRQGG